MLKVYCNLCEKEVDKTETTSGFGAMSIITKEYVFNVKKLKGTQLKQQDFDFCSDCCQKLIKFINEEKEKIKVETK